MGCLDSVSSGIAYGIGTFIDDPVGTVNYVRGNFSTIVRQAGSNTVESIKQVWNRTVQYVSFVRNEYTENMRGLAKYAKPLEAGIANYNKSVIRHEAIKDVVKAVLIATLVAAVVMKIWMMVASYNVAVVIGNLAFPLSAVAIHAYLRFQRVHPAKI